MNIVTQLEAEGWTYHRVMKFEPGTAFVIIVSDLAKSVDRDEREDIARQGTATPAAEALAKALRRNASHEASHVPGDAGLTQNSRRSTRQVLEAAGWTYRTIWSRDGSGSCQ